MHVAGGAGYYNKAGQRRCILGARLYAVVRGRWGGFLGGVDRRS